MSEIQLWEVKQDARVYFVSALSMLTARLLVAYEEDSLCKPGMYQAKDIRPSEARLINLTIEDADGRHIVRSLLTLWKWNAKCEEILASSEWD